MTEAIPVITGAGAVCSLGVDMNAIINRLWSGRSNFSAVPFASAVFGHRRVALAQNFDLNGEVSEGKMLRFMSRETLLAVGALRRCMADAGIIADRTYAGGDMALFAGTGISGIELNEMENMLRDSTDEVTGLFDPIRFGRDGIARLNPLTSFRILPNMPPAVAAIQGGIRGRNLVLNPWEGSALTALEEAWWEIHAGRERIVFCGGSDCKTHSDAFLTFTEYGLLGQGDMVLSEGSAYLALENLQSACQRRAVPYCRIRALIHRSLDVPEPWKTMRNETFCRDMIAEALAVGRLQAQDIDLVFSSGDFHPVNDACERQVLEAIFGDTPILAPKEIIGNTFAAAGLLNTAIGAFILGCRPAAEGRHIERLLITSFAPGSEQFCLVLESL